MITLRGAGGFGDAIYMYPVIKWYLAQGEKIEVLTKYPGVYEGLRKDGLIISDRYAKEPSRECRYAPRYPVMDTTTYQDTLILSRAPEGLPLKIEFECKNEFKFHTTKKICVIRQPSMPMKAKRGGEVLIPDGSIFQEIINIYRKEIYFVMAGNPEGDKTYRLRGINVDLTNQLSIPELFQLTMQSDIVLTQCGFFLPICEALNKKCFVVFSAAGMKSRFKFFPYIRPQKVINKPELVSWAKDDEPLTKIRGKFEELLARGGK